MELSNRKALGTQVLVLFGALFFAGAFSSCTSNECKTKEEGSNACSCKCMKTKTTASLKSQTTCPVMGGKVDKSLYADVNGYRIYVCCSGCINEIKKDPDKYIKKLHEMGVEIEKAPEKTKTAK